MFCYHFYGWEAKHVPKIFKFHSFKYVFFLQFFNFLGFLFFLCFVFVFIFLCVTGISGLEQKLGQIDPEWNKSGTFLRSVSSASQNLLKLILKRPRFVPFDWDQSDRIWMENLPSSYTTGCSFTRLSIWAIDRFLLLTVTPSPLTQSYTKFMISNTCIAFFFKLSLTYILFYLRIYTSLLFLVYFLISNSYDRMNAHRFALRMSHYTETYKRTVVVNL